MFFPTRDLSLSQNRNDQRFELDLQIDGDSYRYVLVIEHDRHDKRMRIREELLEHKEKPIFEFRRGNAQLYHDDYKKGPAYPFDWRRSGIGVLNERSDNRKLTKFKHALASFIIASPCPPLFESEAKSEDGRFDTLDRLLRNFVGWYRAAAQENMGAIADLFSALREVLPGFDTMNLIESGENSRVLKVAFRRPNGNSGLDHYSFSQLSDGQRMLIALYSLIFPAASRPCSIEDCRPGNTFASPQTATFAGICGCDS